MTWILARVFEYLPSFFSQALDFLEFRDTENQQFEKTIQIRLSCMLLPEIQISPIIIRCVFSSLSIGRESTTWPANNWLQIMVCSCVVPSKRVLLLKIFGWYSAHVYGTTFSREKWQIAAELPESAWHTVGAREIWIDDDQSRFSRWKNPHSVHRQIKPGRPKQLKHWF